jgi:two-component system, cell cycle sensor histidine kinase and response regulator CckA
MSEKTKRQRQQEQIDVQATLLNQVREAIVVVDVAGLITYWNKQAESLYQWTEQEALGKTVNELILPPGTTTLRPHVREAIEKYGYWEGETPVRRKDGTPFTVILILSQLRGSDGKPIGFAGVNIDISEMKRVEAQLRQKTNQLQTITDAMARFLETGSSQEANHILLQGALRESQSSYGFAGILADGPVLRVLAHEGVIWSQETNREFYENAVRTYERVGYLEFKNLNNLFGKVITTGQPVLSNDCKNDPRSGGLPAGHPPLNSFLGVPVLKEGAAIGMIGVANRPEGYTNAQAEQLQVLAQTAGILFDSYRRKQDQEKLEEQLRQSQKMEAIGRLAGGIAHDFNNVLTVIKGYSHFLMQDNVSPEIREPVSGIQNAADRATDLTRQLLAFSRRQVFEARVFDLNSLIREIAPMIQRLIGEDIELKFTYETVAATIKADKSQIQQVLLNLAINARDAMPRGGQLTIRTGIGELEAATRRAHPHLSPGRFVLISVADNGSGIDAAALPYIFDPFFTTKDLGKGTGLGLSTVYGIVEQSGGAIEVETEIGRGTTFHIGLPFALESAETESEPAQDVKATSIETILLVEDDDPVRVVASRTLRENGYEILEAANGEEALRLGKEFDRPIHLILTDVVMPGASGPETAAQLKLIRPEAQTLFMSGHVGETIVRHGIDESGFAFIEKPFTPQSLLRKVQQVLRKGGQVT